MSIQRTYTISRVKVKYGTPDVVLGSATVAEDELYRELDAYGVAPRQWTYEDATSDALNGEYVKWQKDVVSAVASTWDVQSSTQENLEAFADIMADALITGVVPVLDALTPLHHAALELNRRHRHASLQDDFQGAVLTMHDYTMYLDQTDYVDVQVTICALRAHGAALDLGTDEEWVSLERAGYTRETSRDFLHFCALTEGRRRGFDHRPRVATLVPADADGMVAPF